VIFLNIDDNADGCKRWLQAFLLRGVEAPRPV
jgi:hypothetical protein